MLQAHEPDIIDDLVRRPPELHFVNAQLRLIASFQGAVRCLRESTGPLGLTLIGQTRDCPAQTVSIAFSAPTPAELPQALEDIQVECLGSGAYRIRNEQRQWILTARAIHVHREIAAAFYRAVVPRTPRWTKRLFWRLLLAAVRYPAGKRLLLALRRR